MTNSLLRSLPSIHELLETREARELAARTSHEYARERLREAIDEIRREILAAGGLSQDAGYECVLMQGSGTFCVEGVITSIMPREARTQPMRSHSAR